VHRAIHRLHGRVRQERRLIHRLNLRGGARHGVADVADRLRDSAATKRGLFELVVDVPWFFPSKSLETHTLHTV
jgi:hypothetical protein